LIVIQVPASDKIEFKKFLAGLGYPHWDESDNPAYKLFLA
jgi:threonine dehydratase